MDLPAIVESGQAELIVLADGPECDEALERLLEIPRRRFRVVGLSSFYEWAFGRVPVPYLTPSWFMSLIHLRQRASARWSKRTFDLAVASLALVVLAPVLVVVALLVATTPGPVVFRQTRIGERGRLFTIYKFRTMRIDAESAGGPVWASAGDPRATRIGRILRRTHLDELPQLLNVLRGEMSIVGPRPERPEFIELLEAVVPAWGRRLLVKPGMTGWAQVRAGYAADCESTAVKLSYDLWYLRHRSLAIDLAVCAKTFIVVLGARSQEPRVEPAGAAPAGRRTRRAFATPGVGAALVLCLTGLGRERILLAGARDPSGAGPVAGATALRCRRRSTPPRPPAPYRVPEGAVRSRLRPSFARLSPGTKRGGSCWRRYLPQPAALPQPVGTSPLRGEARRRDPRGGAEPRRQRGAGRRPRPRDRLRRRQPLANRRRCGRRGLGHGAKLGRARLDAERPRSSLRGDRRPAARRADRPPCRRARVHGLRRRRRRQRADAPPCDRKVLDLRPRRRRRLAARPGVVARAGRGMLWVGNSGSVRRVRAQRCAWTGLWTGTATHGSRFEDIDVARTPTGVYIEHYTHDSVFRRLRVASSVKTGVVAEWADPAWNSEPASVGNVIEDSRFESWLAGVYLDAGTTRTTVRRSTFANQRWAAIGDYRGIGNAYYGNDYRRIKPGAAAISHGRLGGAAPRRGGPAVTVVSRPSGRRDGVERRCLRGARRRMGRARLRDAATEPVPPPRLAQRMVASLRRGWNARGARRPAGRETARRAAAHGRRQVRGAGGAVHGRPPGGAGGSPARAGCRRFGCRAAGRAAGRVRLTTSSTCTAFPPGAGSCLRWDRAACT